VFDVSHPCQTVSGRLHDLAANEMKQFLFVRRARDDAIAFRLEAERPVQSHDAGLLFLEQVDVFDHRDEIGGRAALVADHRNVQARPKYVSILADVSLLHGVGADFMREHGAHIFQIAVQVFGVSEIMKIGLEQGLLVVSEYLAQPVVDPEPAPVRRDQRDADRRLIESGLETIFALDPFRAGKRRSARQSLENHASRTPIAAYERVTRAACLPIGQNSNRGGTKIY
jgi:hypothetical protein